MLLSSIPNTKSVECFSSSTTQKVIVDSLQGQHPCAPQPNKSLHIAKPVGSLLRGGAALLQNLVGLREITTKIASTQPPQKPACSVGNASRMVAHSVAICATPGTCSHYAYQCAKRTSSTSPGNCAGEVSHTAASNCVTTSTTIPKKAGPAPAAVLAKHHPCLTLPIFHARQHSKLFPHRTTPACVSAGDYIPAHLLSMHRRNSTRHPCGAGTECCKALL